MGDEKGPAEGQESPAIKENQNEKAKTQKTKKSKKLDYYKAHKLMHAMYSENTVNDIYDLINDDSIDLDQFACVCDPTSYFYSDISAAELSSSKFDENASEQVQHNQAQTLHQSELFERNTSPSDVGMLSRHDRAPDAGDMSPKSGPEGGRIDEAKNKLVEQGPHGPATTPQAAPNPILSGCGMGTNESEGIHVNSDHTTVDTPHIRLHNIHKGELFPYIPHPCKAPESGSVGTHPSPDGTLTSTDAEADVAPRGLGVLITHTNSLANGPKGAGGEIV